MLTIDKVYDAQKELAKVLRKTPLIHAPRFSIDANVFIKPENLQVTGSFKVRGAYYKIAKLSETDKKRGVIACSAGNHAQGVALGSQVNNINAKIFVPSTAPISKVEATKRYGAEVVLVNGIYDDAYAAARAEADQTGAVFVHPFDDEEIIAGQGTIGLEIYQELSDADAVVVPIGGGGLISGIAYTIKTLNPRVKVYGVQASGAPSMKNAVEHGQIEELASVSTIADGIAVKKPGDITYEICNKYVDGIVTVSDDEISAAILALMEQHKLVTEGAGAVAVAAAMFGKIDLKGQKAVCVLSGGNIDVTILSRVIKRGLLMSGRSCQLMIELVDKPGQLKNVSRIIADLGGNVTSVHHERANEGSDVNGCYLRIILETRNFEHIEQIKKALTDFGFKLLD